MKLTSAENLRKIFDKILAGYLKDLNAKLLTAANEGEHFLHVKIPSNLEKAVLKELDEAGYKVFGECIYWM